jgi:hypothetical protein
LATYRLYSLRHGIPRPSAVLRCGCDEDAVRGATSALQGRLGELWSGSRFVGRLNDRAAFGHRASRTIGNEKNWAT